MNASVSAPATLPATATTPMDVLAVLGAAAALGVAGDLLFRNAGAGLNVLVWIAGLAAWATYLSRDRASRPVPDAWQLPAVFFAACFAFRTSETLRVLDFLALAGTLSLPLLHGRGVRLRTAGLLAYAHAGAATLLHAAAGWVPLVFLETRWREAGPWARRAGPIAAGIAVAVPILAIFGGLFAAADPVFSAAVESALAFDVEPVVQHVVLASGFAALGAGYLRARLWGDRPPARALPSFPTSGATVLIATGAMTLMFLLYVAVQLRYLFGGAAYVQATAGLSLAEYARRGFFESIAASGLSLPVLLLGDWLLDAREHDAGRSFRALAAVQAGLIGIVLVSAADRLRLYVGAYGLTEDRIVAAGGLLWIGAVSAWLVRTVARGRRERFACGALVSGLVVLGGLNAVNPDALTARVNLARAARGAELDVQHLGGLSLDAAPAILARAGALAPDARCAVLARIEGRLAGGASHDWRDWTVAEWRAWSALAAAPSDWRCEPAAPAAAAPSGR